MVLYFNLWDLGILMRVCDQVWYIRHMPGNGRHSAEAIELVEKNISRLDGISDGCAERFPFETIEENYSIPVKNK